MISLIRENKKLHKYRYPLIGVAFALSIINIVIGSFNYNVNELCIKTFLGFGVASYLLGYGISLAIMSLFNLVYELISNPSHHLNIIFKMDIFFNVVLHIFGFMTIVIVNTDCIKNKINFIIYALVINIVTILFFIVAFIFAPHDNSDVDLQSMEERLNEIENMSESEPEPIPDDDKKLDPPPSYEFVHAIN